MVYRRQIILGIIIGLIIIIGWFYWYSTRPSGYGAKELSTGQLTEVDRRIISPDGDPRPVYQTVQRCGRMDKPMYYVYDGDLDDGGQFVDATGKVLYDYSWRAVLPWDLKYAYFNHQPCTPNLIPLFLKEQKPVS